MIVLDTHVLVWLVAEPKRLSRPAVRAIERAARTSGIAIASITLWEIATLLARGRLRSRGTIEQTVRRFVEVARAETLDLTPEVAATAAQLSGSVPTDPADRLLVATALVHAVPLVTSDDRILSSGSCRTIW